jgi:uncharacterized membrane protein (UPF0127 family)
MRKCPPTTPAARAAIHPVVSAALILTLASACGHAQGDEIPPAKGPAQDTAVVQQQGAPAPNHAWVIFGKDTVVAEVARTQAEREKGLMNRQKIPQGTGMIFVFDNMAVQSFWMENTYVPLDIAFMDASYRVVNIDHMAPMTTDSHESDGPVMFALEVPQGWFAAHGVKAGDHATVIYGIQLKTPGS